MDYKEFLAVAYREATNSHDPSTQNGALILIDGKIETLDHNRFPDGVEELPERYERPLKYKVIEHAERNAIFAAAKKGICTHGATMVCPWAACSDCARAIIQAGIKTLVTHKQAFDRSPDHWKKDIEIAFTMFEEAKINIVWYDGIVGGPEVLHSGQKWNP